MDIVALVAMAILCTMLGALAITGRYPTGASNVGEFRIRFRGLLRVSVGSVSVFIGAPSVLLSSTYAVFCIGPFHAALKHPPDRVGTHHRALEGNEPQSGSIADGLSTLPPSILEAHRMVVEDYFILGCPFSLLWLRGNHLESA